MMPAQTLTERSRRRAAVELMETFATSTGLTSAVPPRRYLWTDAFAVGALLGLHGALQDRRYLYLALALIEQVHDVLGRHRPDDVRSGWISGLGEAEARDHPTIGGLRIGKSRPERVPREPFDPGGEWDRDGQYYHYLTRWTHALQRVFQVTGNQAYHRWAVELARTATERFTSGEGSEAFLYWKMSIDLTRPLVPSAGLHDPLDGLLTLESLLSSAPPEDAASGPLLGPFVERLHGMCRARSWITDDPLGAGSLLMDAYRAMRTSRCRALCPSILSDAVTSLHLVEGSRFWLLPASHRLAFRELGLTLGIRAGRRVLQALGGEDGPSETLGIEVSESDRSALKEAQGLADHVEEFWIAAENRRAEGWSAHRDISQVMLAASLVAAGYLG